MIRRTLLALAALACLAGPAPAQPAGGKTDETASKWPDKDDRGIRFA